MRKNFHKLTCTKKESVCHDRFLFILYSLSTSLFSLFLFKISFPAITDAAAARTIIIGVAAESPVTGFFPDSSEPSVDGVSGFLFYSFFTKSLAALASFSVASLISSTVASLSSSTAFAFASAASYTFQLSTV